MATSLEMVDSSNTVSSSSSSRSNMSSTLLSPTSLSLEYSSEENISEAETSSLVIFTSSSKILIVLLIPRVPVWFRAFFNRNV